MQNSEIPLVSVIINNYNYARFLHRAIESALDQDYPNIETIVVDDGSTDGSLAVIKSFGDAVTAVLKENGGQGSSYNAGFAVSQGEIVHFLDADDYLEKDAIKKVVSIWKVGVAKVHFFLRVVDGASGAQTDALVPSGFLASGNLAKEVLDTGCYISPPATGNLYSRDCLSKILPMPQGDWKTAADLYCIFSSVFEGEVLGINEALGAYRVHGCNIDAQTRVSPELLRYRLKKEMRRDQLLVALAAQKNLDYKAGAVANHIMHLKLRLSSYILDRANHPFPEDRLIPLLDRTVRKCWSDDSFSIPKKSLFTSWIIALLCTGSRLRDRLLTLGFAPVSRPKLVQKMLSALASKEVPTPYAALGSENK